MIPTYFMLSFELEYNLDVCMDIDCDSVPHLKNQLAIIKDVTTRHTLFDTPLHVYCDIVDNCFFFATHYEPTRNANTSQKTQRSP